MVRIYEMKIKKFKCSSCSFESYYKPAMQTHLKRKHKDENCKIIRNKDIFLIKIVVYNKTLWELVFGR